MSIFKFTLKKYIVSPSTWIITGVSMFVAAFLGGYLPFHSKIGQGVTAEDYAQSIITIVGVITSFLAIFVSVFTGFKASTMYKDEVEDGTFLLMLSKPQSRTKIIFQKWLSLQVITIMYTFLTVFAFSMAILLFDNGDQIKTLKESGVDTLSSRIFIVGFVMWGVLYVISLIFNSIALLISTKVSVGTTVGVSIAIGVIIPLTALVGMFTAKPAYANLTNSFSQDLEETFPDMTPKYEDAINSGDFEVDLPNTMTLGEMLEAINQRVKSNNKAANDITKGLAKLGIATGETDVYRWASAFDLNYQVEQLGGLATDTVMPSDFAKNSSITETGTGLMSTKMTTVVTNSNVFKIGDVEEEMVKRVSDQVVNALELALSARQFLYTAGIIDWGYNLTDKAETYFKSKNVYDDVEQDLLLLEMSLHHPLGTVIKSATLSEHYHEEIYNYPERDQITSDAYNNMLTRIQDDDAKAGKGTYLPTESQLDELTPEEKLNILNPFININKSEKEIFNDLLSMAHYSDTNKTKMFVGVENKEYADKWTLLIVYITLALILTPLSFFIVRRQDFR